MYLCTDPILRILVFRRCDEVDCTRAALRNAYVSCYFQKGSVIGTKAEAIQATKQVRGINNVLTFATLPAMSVCFSANVVLVVLGVA